MRNFLFVPLRCTSSNVNAGNMLNLNVHISITDGTKDTNWKRVLETSQCQLARARNKNTVSR